MHARRCRTLSRLTFGSRKGTALARWFAPGANVLAAGLLAWGLLTLLLGEPKSHQISGQEVEEADKHVLLALDVSPSMRLQDAGPEGDQSRMRRAAAVMHSFFARVPVEQYRVSVVAFYTAAKPVVQETSDMEVVGNILGDLPMHYAFEKGKTDLLAGIAESGTTARHWNPRSATLIIVSDGDTVPGSGMPGLPASIADVIVVGVGDSQTGTFIDGHQSRQDVSTLQQLAVRLNGTYHNANTKHLPTDLLRQLAVSAQPNPFENLTRREYALIAIGIGATLLASIPVLLHFFGTRWMPGIVRSNRAAIARSKESNVQPARVA